GGAKNSREKGPELDPEVAQWLSNDRADHGHRPRRYFRLSEHSRLEGSIPVLHANFGDDESVRSILSDVRADSRDGSSEETRRIRIQLQFDDFAVSHESRIALRNCDFRCHVSNVGDHAELRSSGQKLTHS